MKNTEPPVKNNNIGRQWWFEGISYATGCNNYDRRVQDVIKGIAAVRKRDVSFARLLLTTNYKNKSAVYINLFVTTNTKVEENWLRRMLRVEHFESTMINTADKQATIIDCLDGAEIVIDETM